MPYCRRLKHFNNNDIKRVIGLWYRETFEYCNNRREQIIKYICTGTLAEGAVIQRKDKGSFATDTLGKTCTNNIFLGRLCIIWGI